MFNANNLDQYTNLATNARLSSIYITLANDVLRFSVEPLTMTPLKTNKDLEWSSEALLVNKSSKNFNRSDLVDLASVVANDLTLRISLAVIASWNEETGEQKVLTSLPCIKSLRDENGTIIPDTDDRYIVIARKLAEVRSVNTIFTNYTPPPSS